MIHRAIVTDSRDPSGRGRIRVTIPTVSGSAVSDWIWPVITSGYVVQPKAGEQVWVMFENGDKETPVWVGKAAVTKTGVSDQTKGYATLIERIETLEAQRATMASQIASLQSRVSVLEGKAHVH